MSLYERIAGLPVEIGSASLERSAVETGSGFTRVTTTIRLRGGAAEGIGEDVVYDGAAHATAHTRVGKGSAARRPNPLPVTPAPRRTDPIQTTTSSVAP